MIGFVDETMLAAIRKVWSLLAADVTEWRRMFHANLGNDRIDKLFAQLTGASTRYTGPVDKYVKFGLAELLAESNDAPPGVFVRMANIRVNAQTEGSNENEGYLQLGNTIEVICLAERKDVAAALATAAANCIWTRRLTIAEETGLEGPPHLTGANEIGPIRDLLPDRGMATWYRLNYVCGSDMQLVTIAEVAATARTISINDERAVDEDGNIGRVKPNATN